jgi:hypothetical protein
MTGFVREIAASFLGFLPFKGDTAGWYGVFIHLTFSANALIV